MTTNFYFFDTSALVKRYVNEIGSTWVQNITRTDTNNIIVASRLAWVETLSAFFRAKRQNSISNSILNNAFHAFQYDFSTQYQILEPTVQVVDIAGELVQKHPLRAYDSVQLASALILYSALSQTSDITYSFVCADMRLLQIAQKEGLTSVNPAHVS